MIKAILLGGIAALSLTSCTTADQPTPLVFARTQTVGVSIAGTVPDQGAHLTLGYSDRNLAIVPTTTNQGAEIRSTATENNQPFNDALSVLGQFAINAKASNVETSLGTFFSTGLAARNLAEGFRDKLRGFGPAAAAGSVIPRTGNSSGGDE
jgi:hypothetical protein